MLTRPWFIVPPPTVDMKWSTYGSCRNTSATASWWSRIASNELPSIVSVLPWICPVSSVGMNPLGTTTKRTAVAARIPAENARLVGR